MKREMIKTTVVCLLLGIALFQGFTNSVSALPKEVCSARCGPPPEFRATAEDIADYVTCFNDCSAEAPPGQTCITFQTRCVPNPENPKEGTKNIATICSDGTESVNTVTVDCTLPTPLPTPVPPPPKRPECVGISGAVAAKQDIIDSLQDILQELPHSGRGGIVMAINRAMEERDQEIRENPDCFQ